MDNEDKQTLLDASYYKNELQATKRSIEALIVSLKCAGTNHPQYDQLEYLKNRSQEIENQLRSLNQIITKLENKA